MGIYRQSLISGALAIAVACIFQPVTANAACAVAEAEGRGGSVREAGFRARQNAAYRAYQSGARQASNISFSEPACYYIDDFSGGDEVNCTVQASWCTTPVAVAPPPAPPPPNYVPHFPGKPHFRNRRQACRKFTAEASAYSLRGAQSLAYRTLDDALRARTGRSAGSYGVRIGAPGCHQLGGHYAQANIVQCRMSAEVCG